MAKQSRPSIQHGAVHKFITGLRTLESMCELCSYGIVQSTRILLSNADLKAVTAAEIPANGVARNTISATEQPLRGLDYKCYKREWHWFFNE
jgi:hypothetical protein